MMEGEEGNVETWGEDQPPNSVTNAQATDEVTGMVPAHDPGTAAFVETEQSDDRADDSALGDSASSQRRGVAQLFQPTSEDVDRCMALTIISIAAYIYRCVRRKVETPWQPPYGNDDNAEENVAVINDDASQEETGYWSLDEDFNPFEEE